MNSSLSADYDKKQKINTGTRIKGLSLFFISDQIFVFKEKLNEFIIIVICTIIIITVILKGRY